MDGKLTLYFNGTEIATQMLAGFHGSYSFRLKPEALIKIRELQFANPELDWMLVTLEPVE